jgi:broad specificity phosphatase PhoE
MEPDLVEWNYGDYEGKRTVDIHEERPGWNVWRDGCPHGETPANISDRADRLLARLCELSGNVALFFARPIWLSSCGALDRISNHRSSTFRTQPGIDQHPGT